jgi:hypothetical protein
VFRVRAVNHIGPGEYSQECFEIIDDPAEAERELKRSRKLKVSGVMPLAFFLFCLSKEVLAARANDYVCMSVYFLRVVALFLLLYVSPWCAAAL